MVWANMSLDGRTDLYVFARGGRGDRGQSAYGARPPLGFYFVTILFLVIPEI